MIAGVVLSADKDGDCHVALLSDGLECLTVQSNAEIAEVIEERTPKVVAVDSSESSPGRSMTESEQELVEDGHSFVPNHFEAGKSKRLEDLKRRVKGALGVEMPAFIRFDPGITSSELGLDSDRALESMGIDSSAIESAAQFDAVLGAVTARYYEQNQTEEKGVVVPKNV